MDTAGIVAGMGLVVAGIGVVLVVGWRARAQGGILAYLSETDGSGQTDDPTPRAALDRRASATAPG
jgi:hypothetical protein